MHNIGGLIWIKGEVDLVLLEEAIQLFIQAHEGLRAQIIEREDSIFQYFEAFRRRELRILDFSGHQDPKAAANNWAKAEFGKSFSLQEQPLYDFAIVKVYEQLNAYFVKFHHLVSDGWSFQIMAEQVNLFYTKLRSGEAVEPFYESKYSDYVVQEQSYLSSVRFEKNKSYWLEKFQTIPDTFLQRSTNKLNGRRKTFWIDESLSHEIKQYVQTNRCSLNTFFLSLVLLYQHKITHEEDLIIGTPVLNRSGAKEKRIVGMFTSTLPFRTTVDSAELVSIFISRVNKQLLECYYHQKFPYDLLVQELQLRKKGYDQLFQICVNYYNTKLVSEWEGNIVENEELYCGQQLYPLQVVIKEWSESGNLEIKIDYQIGDYTDESVEQLFQRLMVLAQQVINQEMGKTVGQLDLMTDSERHLLVHKWNSTEENYPKDKLVQQLFSDQVTMNPQRIAAVLEDRSLTYLELGNYADRLAYKLVQEGIGKGDILALLFNHSFEMLIAILAVLKTGAAYLPIDVTYPEERIRYILEDSRAETLLFNVDILKAGGYCSRMIRVDQLLLESLPPATEEILSTASPQDPAYVIYTSGSTGNPKGVVIKHQGLMNYTWWAQKEYYKNERDVAALYSSPAFDLTITSIFPPLINGNTVAIYPAVEDEFVLERIIDDNIATVLKLTPAHLSLIKHRDNTRSSVRMLIVGGENLKSEVAAQVHSSFGGQATLINEYGPTETVVGCIVHRFNPGVERQVSVPIGRPIANTQVYLLDEQLEPVAIGVVGELYIAGDGVAAGYLRKPELTSNSFIKNPFGSKSLMYKTGDLAYLRPDGSLEYVGRNDSQIKLNGYRIELEEIENHLMKSEEIHDAIVIASHDDLGTTSLAAYLVADPQDISTYEVRKALLDRVPAYMVPHYFVFMDKLPLTGNGKVDRKALPDPKVAFTRPVMKDELNEDEEILLKVMQDVLNLKHITLQDNFYQLGGDSIKAIQIMTKLRDAGLSIQVRDILSYALIGEIAAAIEQNSRSDNWRESAEGDVKPTPIINWFFSLNLSNPHHFNQSVFLSVKKKFSPEQISLALKEIVGQHDTLWLNFDEVNGEIRYSRELKNGISLEVVQLPGVGENERKIVIQEHSLTCKQSMNMVKGPLLKAVLFKDDSGDDFLLLTAHHLIVDAVSWRILLEDLDLILQAQLAGIPALLPVRTDSYQTWANALEVFSHSEAEVELDYWQNILHTIELPMNTDYKNDEVSTYADIETLQAELSKEDTMRLISNANKAYNTRIGDLLIAALAMACNMVSGRRNFTIEMEGHGREPVVGGVDVSRTVGWFTSIYPVQLCVPDSNIGEQLMAIKEQLRAIPNHGIGFGVLKLAQKLNPYSVKTIRFNYLGEIDHQMRDSIFEIADDATGEEQALENTFTVLLDIVAYIQSNQFKVSVSYSKKDFFPATMQLFVRHYVEHLQQLIYHCSEKVDVNFTPSDFNTVCLSQSELDNLFS